MKKILVLGILALVLAAASERQASAYCKFNVGFGFNLGFIHAPSYRLAPLPPPPGFFCGQDAQSCPGFNFGCGPIVPPSTSTTPLWQAPAPLPQSGSQQAPSGIQRSQFLDFFGNPGYQPANYDVPMSNQAPSYWYGN